MNHDPFKINEAILDLWRDLKAGEDYIHRLEIRNASLVSERERIEPELEQRCRELNLSLAQQAIQLKQIGELKAEVQRLTKDLADEKSANANVEGRQNSANRGLSMENASLKAEVERLKNQRTKLIESAEELFRFVGEELYGPIDHFEAAWEAAKEGKQP